MTALAIHPDAPLGLTVEEASGLSRFAASHDWGREGLSFVHAPGGRYGVAVKVRASESTDWLLGGHAHPDGRFNGSDGVAWALFYSVATLRAWAGY